jgi:TM2 domain-containing membrane protein YozV
MDVKPIIKLITCLIDSRYCDPMNFDETDSGAAGINGLSGQGPVRYCSACGARIPNSAVHCPNCGTSSVFLEPTHKDPAVAAILSFFVPGLGQVYNGDMGRGLLFFFGCAIGYLLLIIPGVLVFVFCIYDAYDTAKKINIGEQSYKKTGLGDYFAFIVLSFCIVFAFFVVIAFMVSGIYF